MPRGRRHNDETRAAVLAALLAGQGVNEVARQYHLDSGLVSRWKQKIPADKLQQIASDKRGELDAKIYAALNAIVDALEFSARLLRTESGWAWAKQHSPAELATFIGVLTDKGFRLLEAKAAAEQRDAGGGESPGSADPV